MCKNVKNGNRDISKMKKGKKLKKAQQGHMLCPCLAFFSFPLFFAYEISDSVVWPRWRRQQMALKSNPSHFHLIFNVHLAPNAPKLAWPGWRSPPSRSDQSNPDSDNVLSLFPPLLVPGTSLPVQNLLVEPEEVSSGLRGARREQSRVH